VEVREEMRAHGYLVQARIHRPDNIRSKASNLVQNVLSRLFKAWDFSDITSGPIENEGMKLLNVGGNNSGPLVFDEGVTAQKLLANAGSFGLIAADHYVH